MISPCSHGFGHEDAARRMADAVNRHYASHGWDAVGKFCAIRLQDGSSDMTMYDTKQDAVRHQANEFQCLYVKLIPMPMGICEAETLLMFHRKAYDAGFRLADPDSRNGGRDLIFRGRSHKEKARQFAAFNAALNRSN